MKMDLRHTVLEAEIGRLAPTDISKPVANVIYGATPDIGVMDAARKLYYSGVLELPDNMIPHIAEIVGKSALLAYVKRAVLENIDLARKGER